MCAIFFPRKNWSCFWARCLLTLTLFEKCLRSEKLVEDWRNHHIKHVKVRNIDLQANFIFLSLIWPSTCLMQFKSFRFKFLIVLLKSNILTSLFAISRLNFSFSFVQFLLRLSLWVNIPLEDFLEILCLSRSARSLDLDLSLFDLNVN